VFGSASASGWASCTAALAAAAAVAIENARLYESSRQRERWQNAIAEIGSAVLSGGETGDVLTLVAQNARRLTGADFATIALPDADGILRIEIADGYDDTEADQEIPRSRWSVHESHRTAEFITELQVLVRSWLNPYIIRLQIKSFSDNLTGKLVAYC
jgi:GAF domain-containing protein